MSHNLGKERNIAVTLVSFTLCFKNMRLLHVTDAAVTLCFSLMSAIPAPSGVLTPV